MTYNQCEVFLSFWLLCCWFFSTCSRSSITGLLFKFGYIRVTYIFQIMTKVDKVHFIQTHFIDSSRSISTSTCDPKDRSYQDNRCLFWDCYRGTTIYHWTNWPVADGDMRGGIITGELTWREIRSWHLRGDKREWWYTCNGDNCSLFFSSWINNS